MPAVIAACPNAVYVVLGATHPNLARQHGEAYRESLSARAADLGVGDHVVFRDQFVDQDLLLEYIAMCDVYVTPYLNEEQMTSGTLAWSFGLGKAVVSTPYWHAKELLADGCGVLVPFRDAGSLGEDVSKLLADDNRRMVLRRRAYAASRSMTWARTAERYFEVFEAVRPRNRLGVVPLPITSAPLGARPTPAVRTDRFLDMCDDTGMLQHAVFAIADRSHGYCVDDNARALMMSALLGTSPDAPIPGAVIARFAAFVQHAWNPDNGRFRNFMSYDRRWLEAEGSEDSHGRTVWSLGVCARDDVDATRRRWAATLFDRSVGITEEFGAPRAWAFTLLGIDAIRMSRPLDPATRRLRSVLAGRLMNRLAEVESPDWMWFDDALGYDNARLPQALLVTGLATNNATMVNAGLRTLRWLMRHQTSPTGLFRPVGSHTFGRKRMDPHPFDQQPDRGGGHRLRLPGGGEGRGRSTLAARGTTRLRLVPRRERSWNSARGCRQRRLSRRPSSRSRQRESWRRIPLVLSSRPYRDPSSRQVRAGRKHHPPAADDARRMIFPQECARPPPGGSPADGGRKFVHLSPSRWRNSRIERRRSS